MHGHGLQRTTVIRNGSPTLESRSHVYPASNVIWRYKTVIRMFFLVPPQNPFSVSFSEPRTMSSECAGHVACHRTHSSPYTGCSRISPQTIVDV